MKLIKFIMLMLAGGWTGAGGGWARRDGDGDLGWTVGGWARRDGGLGWTRGGPGSGSVPGLSASLTFLFLYSPIGPL